MKSNGVVLLSLVAQLLNTAPTFASDADCKAKITRVVEFIATENDFRDKVTGVEVLEEPADKGQGFTETTYLIRTTGAEHVATVWTDACTIANIGYKQD